MLSRKAPGDLVVLEEQLKEKCGVIGVWCAEKIASLYIRKGLSALQHRGQESAGISIYTPENKIQTYKGMGLIPNVLTTDVIHQLGESKVAIGHNRYSTTGSSTACNAQPITLTKGKFQISIGHNGNIPEYQHLLEQLEEKSKEECSSDTYLVAQLLLQERPKYSDWDETLKNVLPRIRGAFCFVILTSDGAMYGARDTYGIRPFCLGKASNGWIIASESVAVDLTGAEFLRDVKPGEVVKINFDGELSSFFFGEPKRPQNCIFEYIYFSRPDSFENGIRVRNGREASGKLLAKRILKKGIKADVVIPVFDSGYPAAKGVAVELGLPLIDAITVSHYIGRTFIQPGQENRMAAVNGKHNIVPDEIFDKRVIVVDDSAVRLTTSKRLCLGLKDAGAEEVYMVFASPPVVNHCDLGIDMKSKKELPASNWASEPLEVIEKNVAELMSANGVVYLPIEEISRAMERTKEDFYHYPFGGPHPIRGPQYEFPKMKKKITSQAKIAVLISGSGTNLQEIIDRVDNGDIEAKIVLVIANNERAYGLERARKHNIPTSVLPYEGKVNDQEKRKEYDRLLLDLIKKIDVDIIVLAGWNFILGNEFLSKVAQKEIPVLNLHPALLTTNLKDTIASSRGIIPVMRGQQAIKDAFGRRLLVSGVTVHQILPKNNFDIGPVILKEEVRIRSNDTLETFEKRIHEAEHRILPTAIKRLIHVMKAGIDVSKGDFYW